MFRKHRLSWNAWNTSPVGTVLKGLSQFAFAFKRSSEVQTLVMRKLNEIQTTQHQASIFLLMSRNCRMLRTRSSRWFRGQPFPKKYVTWRSRNKWWENRHTRKQGYEKSKLSLSTGSISRRKWRPKSGQKNQTFQPVIWCETSHHPSQERTHHWAYHLPSPSVSWASRSRDNP